MQSFEISSKITQEQYVKTLVKSTTQSKAYLIGLGYLFLTIILRFAFPEQDHPDPERTNSLLFYGCIFFVFLIGPMELRYKSRKYFEESVWMHDTIHYRFSDTGIHCTGSGFERNLLWSSIKLKRQVGDYLLLFKTRYNAEVLPKDLFTEIQLQFIHSKIKKSWKPAFFR